MKKIILFAFILFSRMAFSQALAITTLGVSTSTPTTSTITWTTTGTTAAADTRVSYVCGGVTNNYIDGTRVTSHSATLTGLQPGVNCVYTASSQNAASETATGTVQNFTTCRPNSGQLTITKATIYSYYAYGSFTATWHDLSGIGTTPTQCGAAITTPISGTLDINGNLTVLLPDVKQVTPSPGAWTIAFSSFASTGSVSVDISPTGQNFDASATIQAQVSAGNKGPVGGSGGSGAVSSVFARTGAVVSAANDYNFNQLAGTVALATQASGQLPIGNVGSAGLSATNPIRISSAGVIDILGTGSVGVAQGGWGLSTLTANALYAGNGTSAPNAITPPATNGTWQLASPVTASAAVAPVWQLPGVGVNAQTGSYALLYSDRAQYIKESGTTTSTVTLPQVTGITASNFPFVTQNLNSGNETITANAADKINNSATGGSDTLLPNFASFVYQDSSSAPGNWFTIDFPTYAAFGSTGALCSWSTTTGISCGDATGDVTTSGSKAFTLATVNANVGSFTNANITVNAKGLVTAAANGSGGSGSNSGSAGSTGVGIVLTGTSFAPLYGQYSSIITTEANADVAFATAITVSKAYVDLGTATGASQTVVVTLRKNGVNTAVTCTVGNAAQTCTDTTHSVTTVAGDLLDWQLVLNTLTLTTNTAIGSQVGSAVQTYSGNTTTAASVSGALTSGDTTKVDASGNLVDTGQAFVATVPGFQLNPGGIASSGAVAANSTRIWSFYLPYTVTTTKVGYDIATADNTSNPYDIGIYNSTGSTLLAHIGATAGTSFAPSTGAKTLSWTGSATLPPGKYLLAQTNVTNTAILGGLATVGAVQCDANPSATTSGGVLLSSITPNADSYTNCTMPTLLIY